MKKILSLIKATMSEGMNLFKINTRKSSKFTKVVLPIYLVFVLMFVMYSYSDMIIKELQKVNMEYFVLTFFAFAISLISIMEGIYKSGSLLFNSKDNDLLLSLPISRNTIFFIRVLKFYIFELIYNSLFLLPTMILYPRYISVGFSYYIVSFIALLVMPIVPIIISTVVGMIITFFSSKFRSKNIIQTIITMAFLIVIMYVSFNSNKLLAGLARNANDINDFITKLYYPAGAYTVLVTNFSLLKLFEYISINIGLFIIAIFILGKFYFNINSSSKSIKLKKINKNYTIKSRSIICSLIRKEFNRFINSTVFITNAGFGLIIYVFGCIVACLKYDSIVNYDNLIRVLPNINPDLNITVIYILDVVPLILFGFIIFTSFMTSITSSMISLEGKTFNILKSLPINSSTFVKAKVYAAVLIMVPFILLGDIIVFIKFKFSFIYILLILIASFLLPLVSETIGIIVNLKYPKMDAQNDTEVVKQSMSSMISVFLGMLTFGISFYLLYLLFIHHLSVLNIMLLFILGYAVIYIILLIILHKISDKYFNNIIV